MDKEKDKKIKKIMLDLGIRVKVVMKIMQGIKERLTKLNEYGKKNNDFYIVGFVDGLVNFIDEGLFDYIEKELKKLAAKKV